MRVFRPLALLTLLLAFAGCMAPEEVDSEEGAVTVDTSTPEARKLYDARVRVAQNYRARCKTTRSSSRPRVLVTGFGPFGSITNNATGRIVSTLVPSLTYPESFADEQPSVSTERLNLEGVGDVDVCAMVLPVSWDLAAIFIAKEIEAFSPSFVLMNGVAERRQPLWFELGATNEAMDLADASDVLKPIVGKDGRPTVLLSEASSSERLQANRLSWGTVRERANAAVEAHSNEVDGGERFGDILQGVLYGGYPRASNTYLCNNVTFVTGWLMTHPGKSVRLLRASTKVKGSPNDVSVKLTKSFATVPRIFVHWPSELKDKHQDAAADVMKSIVKAQLRAVSSGDRPTLGDNRSAESPVLPEP